MKRLLFALITLLALTVQGANPSFNDLTNQFGVVVGDGINVVSTGAKGYARIPANITITGWSLVADVTNASITIDVYRTNSTSFQLLSNTGSIWSGAVPTLSVTNINNSIPLAINLQGGDWIQYNVGVSTNAARVYLVIYGNPTKQ